MLQATEDAFVTLGAPSRLGSSMLAACAASTGIEEEDPVWRVVMAAALMGYACRMADAGRRDVSNEIAAAIDEKLIFGADDVLDYEALADEPDRFGGVLEMVATLADDVHAIATLANCTVGAWQAFGTTATYQLRKNLVDNELPKRQLPSPESVENLLRLGYAVRIVDEVAGEEPALKARMTDAGGTYRASIDEWPERQIVANIRACFVGDQDQPHVRAAVVLHQDPALLPEDAEDDARRQAEEDGVPFEGLAEWVVFLLDFDDDDRVGLYMEHDVACLVRAWQSAYSEAEAMETAQAWIVEAGDEPQRVDFRWLPGVYQAATMAFIKGTQPMADLTWFSWVMPATNGYHPMRHYPPKLPEGRDEDEPEVGWLLMPEHAVRDIYADRPW